MAAKLGVPLLSYVQEKNALWRHLASSAWTMLTLARHRPEKIYLQYSFLLLIWIVVYKRVACKCILVVCDCHTKALRRKITNHAAGVPFMALKRLSFSCVDLCLISNTGLVADAKALTDQYFVLPDLVPHLHFERKKLLNRLVLVCSYSADEPLEVMIAAAARLQHDIRIYCTGRIPPRLMHLKKQPHPGIYFTDHLEDHEYIDLIANSLGLIALTTEQDCLQCAGYEALAVMTPCILSDTPALRTFFGNSSVYVEHDPVSILNGIDHLLGHREDLLAAMAAVKDQRHREMEVKWRELLVRIEGNESS